MSVGTDGSGSMVSNSEVQVYDKTHAALPTPHRVWRSSTHQTNTETCKETTEPIILPQGLSVQRFKFSLTVGMYRVVSLSLYDALQTTVIIRRIDECGTNRSTDRIIHPHGCLVQGRKFSEKLLQCVLVTILTDGNPQIHSFIINCIKSCGKRQSTDKHSTMPLGQQADYIHLSRFPLPS